MAAPVPVARQKPTGQPIPDGYQTLLTFTSNPSLAVWERTVKCGAVDGKDPIDTSTMHNDHWHTKHPRTLKDMTDTTSVCGYKGASLNTLQGMVNVLDTITVQFPDGEAVAFYGWIQKAEPGDDKEGEFPEVTLTIVAANSDGTLEQAPVWGSVMGS